MGRRKAKPHDAKPRDVSWRSDGICGDTGKQMLPSRTDADAMIKSLNRHGGPRRAMSVYRCEGCGALHVGRHFGYDREWHRKTHREPGQE